MHYEFKSSMNFDTHACHKDKTFWNSEVNLLNVGYFNFILNKYLFIINNFWKF